MTRYPAAPSSSETLLQAALRHSRFVIASKGVLWGLAAALVFAAVWIPIQDDGKNAFRLVAASVHPGDVDAAKMERPRFTGLDTDNRPYSVTADVATPQPDNTVLLDNIAAELTLQGGAWLNATAKQGILDVAGKHLTLRGGIELLHDNGYAIATRAASLDLAKGSATGDRPVEMHGPVGVMNASGFTIEDRGNVLRFQGPVRATLYPQGSKG